MTTSPDLAKLYLGEFYSLRREFAEVPSKEIRCAGKATKAHPNGEDEMWWLAKGPEMLQRWEDWRNASEWSIWVTPEGVPAIELEINEDFDGTPVKMFIDRVFQARTGALIVLDLKSGSRTPASDLQLGFYAAGIWRKFGVKVSAGTYWMAREGVCTDLVPLDRYTPALLSHYVRKFQKARSEGIYLPHISALCRACGVREYCLAYGGRKKHQDPDYQFVQLNQEVNSVN